MKSGAWHIENVAEGLNDSMLLVVIASKAFVKKPFPTMEIGGVAFHPEKKHERIIPICYDIDPEIFADTYKLFANIQATIVSKENTLSKQLEEVTDEIQIVVDRTRGKLIRSRNAQIFGPLLFTLVGFMLFGIWSYLSKKNTEYQRPSEAQLTNQQAAALLKSDSGEESSKFKPSDNIEPQPAKVSGIVSNLPINASPKSGAEKINYADFVNQRKKVDVSIMIIDPNGSLENSLSSKIGSIYSQTGLTSSIGLLKPGFLRRAEFNDLCDGDVDITEKLKLNEYVNYLVIGKSKFSSTPSLQVPGSIVCNANLEVIVINLLEATTYSFTIDAVDNGATEDQARSFALARLLSKYNDEHSKL